MPLAVRLKLPADGAAEGSLLPVQLLRKYIAYAREHVHPVLSDEAKDILQVSTAGNHSCIGFVDKKYVPNAGAACRCAQNVKVILVLGSRDKQQH